MEKVLSKDGTPIAFERSGHGPALILVGGAMATRAAAKTLAACLAPNFTVFAYDRRWRGDSGDQAPYAVNREVEDIEALIKEANGSAFVFGHSSGATLALDAANQLTSIKKLALYEPPFILDASRPPLPGNYVARLNNLIAEDRRTDAVMYFMTAAMGMQAEILVGMQKSPMWPGLEAVAHTLPYDGMIVDGTMNGKPLPKTRWASVTIPTLVMDGGKSPAFMQQGAEELAAILPHAQRRRLEGQDHGPADEVLVPVLVEFFKG
jgi:pimeloyl-ACP methyl ester carboxylesterase